MKQLYTRLSCIPSFDEGVLLRCEKKKVRSVCGGGGGGGKIKVGVRTRCCRFSHPCGKEGKGARPLVCRLRLLRLHRRRFNVNNTAYVVHASASQVQSQAAPRAVLQPVTTPSYDATHSFFAASYAVELGSCRCKRVGEC